MELGLCGVARLGMGGWRGGGVGVAGGQTLQPIVRNSMVFGFYEGALYVYPVVCIRGCKHEGVKGKSGVP
jgi:hypothetical protein